MYWKFEHGPFSVYIAAPDRLAAEKEVREYIHTNLVRLIGEVEPELFSIDEGEYWYHSRQPASENVAVLMCK